MKRAYVSIVRRSGLTVRDFTAQLRYSLSTPPTTPEGWVAAAAALAIPCERCAGTGRYPKAPGGRCFRCAGHGTQNDSDRRRNFGYDARQIVEG